MAKEKTILEQEVKNLKEDKEFLTCELENTKKELDPLSKELSEKDIQTIEKLENIIENTRITKSGRIHKQDKKVLNSTGLEVIETYNPEEPDIVMIKVKIPTTEEKSMPDNNNTHTITVVRDIEN